MDNTAQVLIEMLKESTGMHMMDSGGENGRHWQRNQSRDFEKEPECTLDIYEKDGIANEWRIDISTFHFLNRILKYNLTLDAQFKEFSKDSDEAHFVDMQNFVDDLKERYDVHGIYGDGDPQVVNTYNIDGCLLDQTIQFIYWEDGNGRINDRAHVILHVHGGADVRGGYGTPHVFDVVEEVGIFRTTDACMTCGECGKYWQTDDGYHFYEEGSTAGKQLETYDLKVIDGKELQCPACNKGVLYPSF